VNKYQEQRKMVYLSLDMAQRQKQIDFINEAEATEKRFNDLQKNNYIINKNDIEKLNVFEKTVLNELIKKLSKVGESK
jgi:hypothetical protein